MSERFERWNDHSCKVKDNQEGILLSWEDVVKKLNEQQVTIRSLKKENRALNSIKKFAEDNGINIFYIDTAFRNCWNDNAKLIEENEQLRKQIQNYEQLISNSYVGEEETLDGWIGKYEIWETELQKYKEKIKGDCDE